MPTTFNFDFSYLLGQDYPDETTPLLQSFSSWSVTDDQDGNDDGSIANGDPFSFTRFTSTGPSSGDDGNYIGLTTGGDPLVLIPFPDFDLYYVLSNTPSLAGSALGPISLVNAPLLCFLEGTRIWTPRGEAAIETLSIGDNVTTVDGRDVPVAWIGRRTVCKLFPIINRLSLVRVRADALGPRTPARDLIVTADHALLVDGMLINAGALVNGTSVAYVPLAELDEGYTVYHVETASHAVILAEGCPAETYVDYVGRQSFDNYAEYLALYGEERSVLEQDVPRITSARHLPAALRARLGAVYSA